MLLLMLLLVLLLLLLLSLSLVLLFLLLRPPPPLHSVLISLLSHPAASFELTAPLPLQLPGLPCRHGPQVPQRRRPRNVQGRGAGGTHRLARVPAQRGVGDRRRLDAQSKLYMYIQESLLITCGFLK